MAWILVFKDEWNMASELDIIFLDVSGVSFKQTVSVALKPTAVFPVHKNNTYRILQTSKNMQLYIFSYVRMAG